MTIKLRATILLLLFNQLHCMETKKAIKEDILTMISICSKHCPFTNKNVRENCIRECYQDYISQKERFLARKYTIECQGLLFNEQWIFKNINELKARTADVNNTLMLCQQWQDLQIRSCVQRRFSLYNKHIVELDKELKDIEDSINNSTKKN